MQKFARSALRRLCTKAGGEVENTTIVGNISRHVSEQWERVGPRGRVGVALYCTVGLSSTALNSYNDGKASLQQFREWNTLQKDKSGYTSEWDAVRVGCSRNVWENFLRGCFWPTQIWSAVMPTIVLRLNPASSTGGIRTKAKGPE